MFLLVTLIGKLKKSRVNRGDSVGSTKLSYKPAAPPSAFPSECKIFSWLLRGRHRPAERKKDGWELWSNRSLRGGLHFQYLLCSEEKKCSGASEDRSRSVSGRFLLHFLRRIALFSHLRKESYELNTLRERKRDVSIIYTWKGNIYLSSCYLELTFVIFERCVLVFYINKVAASMWLRMGIVSLFSF